MNDCQQVRDRYGITRSHVPYLEGCLALYLLLRHESQQQGDDVVHALCVTHFGIGHAVREKHPFQPRLAFAAVGVEHHRVRECAVEVPRNFAFILGEPAAVGK